MVIRRSREERRRIRFRLFRGGHVRRAAVGRRGLRSLPANGARMVGPGGHGSGHDRTGRHGLVRLRQALAVAVRAGIFRQGHIRLASFHAGGHCLRRGSGIRIRRSGGTVAGLSGFQRQGGCLMGPVRRQGGRFGRGMAAHGIGQEQDILRGACRGLLGLGRGGGEKIGYVPVSGGRCRGGTCRETVLGQEQVGHGLCGLRGRGRAEQVRQGRIRRLFRQGVAQVGHVVMAAQDLQDGLVQGFGRDGQGQGVGETGMGQHVPLALVRGQGHGAEGAGLFGQGAEAAQQGRGAGGGFRTADQQHGGHGLASGDRGGKAVGQGPGLAAGTVVEHGGQFLTGRAFGGADQHHGRVRGLSRRGRTLRGGRGLRDGQLQGEDHGGAARAAFQAQEAAVGGGQFPDAGQQGRGAPGGWQARARVAHLEEQVAGMFAVRHTAHRELHAAACGGPDGIRQQPAEDVLQCRGRALIAGRQIGRQAPVQVDGGVLAQRAAGLVGPLQEPAQVEDRFFRGCGLFGRGRCGHGPFRGRLFPDAAGRGWLFPGRGFRSGGPFRGGGIMQQLQGLTGRPAHAFHMGTGPGRQGAGFQSAVLFQKVAQGRAEDLFQTVDGGSGGIIGRHGHGRGGRAGQPGREGQGIAVTVQQTQVGVRDGLGLSGSVRGQGIGGGRDPAGGAHARDDQGAEGRAPQGQGALDEGRQQRAGIEQGQRGAQGGHQAAQQEAARARHSHEPGAEAGGHEDQGQQGPERQVAAQPGEIGPEGQQSQDRAGQGEQQVLEIQRAGMGGGLHEVAGQVGQEHEGQAGGHGADGIGRGDVARAEVGHAEDGMAQGRAHIEGGPEAPLAALGDAAQQGQEHDHGQGQHGGGAEQAFRRVGQIVRCAQGGREPEGRLAVQADIADPGGLAGLGQGQQVAPVGAHFLPLGLAGKGIDVGHMQHGPGGDALSEVQQQGRGGHHAGGGDLQPQPGDADAAGQGPGMQGPEGGEHVRGGHFFHAHVAVRIRKGRQPGQDDQLARGGVPGPGGQVQGQGRRGCRDGCRGGHRQTGRGQGKDEQEREDDAAEGGPPCGEGMGHAFIP